MKQVVVRYKVKADRREENIAYIQKLFEELKARAPDGLRYASLMLEDHRSFVHIASVETEDGSNPLAGIEAFKAFAHDIGSRCEDHPIATPAELLGAYRMFE